MERRLGERIRQARLQYGMSQAELSRRIHISKTAMNHIESGEILDPKVSHIVDIAKVLGLSLDVLFAGEQQEDAYVPTAAALSGC